MPGQNAGLKLTLQPLPSPSAEPEPLPCEIDPEWFLWFSHETGEFEGIADVGLLRRDVVDTVAEFVATVPPYRWHARLLGELCLCSGCAVEFSVSWSGANAPHFSSSGPDFFVYPRDDNLDEPGVMTITAHVRKDGVIVYTSNPIDLVITSGTYYSYCNSSTAGWVPLTNYTYDRISGYPPNVYIDGIINIGSWSSLVFYYSLTNVSRIYVYCNDGGGGHWKVNHGTWEAPVRGAFTPPTLASEGMEITGIGTLEIQSDGYGADWSVYVWAN